MVTLSQFFSGKKKNIYPGEANKDTDLSQLQAPGTKILYDTGLIAKLVNDHKQLVSVYLDIDKAIERKLYAKIRSLLDVFLALFNEHALAEYTKLYVFLDYALRPYPDKHEQVMIFRKEMQEIGKALRLFVHSWKNQGIDASNISSFAAGLHEIGKVLNKRVDVEETQLYQIYADAPKLLISDNKVRH